jgi:hypothetical protein
MTAWEMAAVAVHDSLTCMRVERARTHTLSSVCSQVAAGRQLGPRQAMARGRIRGEPQARTPWDRRRWPCREIQ